MNTFSVVPSPKVSYHEHILSCTITLGKLSKIKVNPFQTNGIIHKAIYNITSGWSIEYIEGSQVIISEIFCIFSLKIDFALANSIDPDEMPHNAAFHLGLHCLHKYLLRGIYSLHQVK